MPAQLEGLSETPTGVRIEVAVKVRASKSRVLGIKAGKLSVALAAAPVDGAANQELIDTLAEHFDLPRRQIEIVSGEKSRRKLVELRGLRAAQVLERLPG
jgi:uncharacterized protein (TIGR00251 family)